MKFYLKTYGCQMNVSDSDYISSQLVESGFSQTADIKEAGVIILNTCSVRQLPEQKAYSFLGRIEPLKKLNPGLKIIVAGCMAQRAGKEIKKRFRIVDLIVGAKDIAGFPETLKKELIRWRISGPGDPAAESSTHSPAHPVSAFVTIMRGCENFCSYCVVPLVRGPEISRSAREILREIEALVGKGVKEITLLGQNVNSYKGGYAPGVRSAAENPAGRNAETLDFPELLEKINAVDGLERVRFMTSHPKDLSDKLIDSMANLEKVCEHLHLPLQSGSDSVLKKMNRRYSSSDYLNIIEKVKKRIPGVNITTDILIGFPGETDDDFKDTLKVLKTAGFDSLFAFKYSSRPGTEAAGLSDDVTLEKKESRLKEVLDLGNGISSERNARLINSVHEVLVDCRSDDVFEGRTRSNKKVSFQSGIDLTGKVVAVKITDVKVNTLSGKLEQVLR